MAEVLRGFGWMFVVIGAVGVALMGVIAKGVGVYHIAMGIGMAASGVMFMGLAAMLDHLDAINNRLTWLMPEEYFEANPEEKPDSMQE